MAAEKAPTRAAAYGDLLERVGGRWPPVTGVGIYGEGEGPDRNEGLVLLYEHETAGFSEFLHQEFGLFEFQLRSFVSGAFFAASRPARGGDSISHGTAGALTGTFGCLVQDPARNPYLLSCNHVIAACNAARMGDEVWKPGADH